MADQISVFQEAEPSLESYWRSVILFGRNVASYKFALAKSLLHSAGVGLAPGAAFGAGGEGHLRLCFAQSEDRLRTACERLAAVLARG